MGYFSGGYSLSETGPETDILLDEINKVFFCQYGVTEYADALTKYNAGKGLSAVYNKKTYILTDYINSTFYFGQTTKALNYASLSLSASGWAVVDSVGVAPLNSPVFTGTPTAPTADENTNDEQIATTAYADRASYNSLMEDTASGAIASFTDGAKNVPVVELTADIEPIQDLHGYDNPWPGGARENKLDPSAVVSVSNCTISNGVVTQTQADTASYMRFKVAAMKSDMSVVQPYSLQAVTSTGVITLSFTKASDTPYVLFGLNGTTRDTTVRYDVSDLANGTYYVQVNFTNITEGSVSWKDMMLCDSLSQTYVPYSNICPITGFTGAEITRCVWGMHNIQMEIGTFNNGQPSEHLRRIRTVDYIPVTEGKTYTISATASKALSVFIACFGSNTASSWVSNIATAAEPRTFTCPTNVNYIRFVLLYTDDTAISPTDVSEVTVVETPTTTYSIDWTDEAGTVYKGTAQYKGDGEWEITDTHLPITFDDVTLVAAGTTTGTGYYRYRYVNADIASYTVSTYAGATALRYQVGYNAGPYTFYNGSGEMVLIFDASSTFDTAAKAKQWLVDNSELIIVPRVTPVVFTISGPDPSTLLGDNNIWSNTGDISVKYRANTAEYIDKRTPDAPDANGTYVFKAIVSGGVKTYQWVAE